MAVPSASSRSGRSSVDQAGGQGRCRDGGFSAFDPPDRGLGSYQTHVVDRLGDDGQGRCGETCPGKSSYFKNETSAGTDKFSS